MKKILLTITLILPLMYNSGLAAGIKGNYSDNYRVGGARLEPRPPTPPYVPFGIRRFMITPTIQHIYQQEL